MIAAAGMLGAGFVGGADGKRAWRTPANLFDPCGPAAQWPEIFVAPCTNWRRTDRLSRAVLLAAEGAVTAAALSESVRFTTALSLLSVHGCLDADARYRRGLSESAGIEPGLFVYTTPNACLGEVAIRHQLRGSSCAMSLFGVDLDDATWEAAIDPVSDGDAPAALVFVGEAVGLEAAALAFLEPVTHMTAYLLVAAPRSAGLPSTLDCAAWAERIIAAPVGAP